MATGGGDEIAKVREDENAEAIGRGGDMTRINKLLKKQEKGKAEMKQIGRVRIPQKASISVLAAE